MRKDKGVTIKGNAHFHKSLMVNAVYADKCIALIRHDCVSLQCNKSKVKGGMIKLRQGPTFFLCSIHQLMQSQTFFSFWSTHVNKTLHWRVNCYPLPFPQCTMINYCLPCSAVHNLPILFIKILRENFVF